MRVYTDDDVLRYVNALRLIGTECANYVGASTCAEDPTRRAGARYSAEAWCDQCIARTALAGANGTSA